MRVGPTARAWQLLADRTLATLGVSESAARAVAYLDRLGANTRQGDLARAIGITEASLVRTLQQLERTGIVARVCDKDDRRANRLALTGEGTALAARIDACLVELRSELLEGLSDKQLKAGVFLLDTIANRIADRRGRS